MKFTIYAVDKAGHSRDVCRTDEPETAVNIVAGLRARDSGSIGYAGVYLTENPEAGDVDPMEVA